mmetsp:Transcript_9525/g.39919  ORF Transcript_9525/g.39919 Transcript_9525/m.39919 type:complete len:212 (-) Transcript_9525:553-1188(-)
MDSFTDERVGRVECFGTSSSPMTIAPDGPAPSASSSSERISMHSAPHAAFLGLVLSGGDESAAAADGGLHSSSFSLSGTRLRGASGGREISAGGPIRTPLRSDLSPTRRRSFRVYRADCSKTSPEPARAREATSTMSRPRVPGAAFLFCANFKNKPPGRGPGSERGTGSGRSAGLYAYPVQSRGGFPLLGFPLSPCHLFCSFLFRSASCSS